MKKIVLKVMLVMLCSIANFCFADSLANHSWIRFDDQYYKNKEIYPAVRVDSLNQGEKRVYIFTPQAFNRDDKLPLVFFHHGWLGMNPLNFGAIIDHLTRSGHAVIYPVYQTGDKTNPKTITQNAVTANHQALAWLKQQGYQLDMARTLYVGFSMGAAINLNIALADNHFGLPKPKGMVLMNPGDAYHVKHGEQGNSIIGKKIAQFPKDIPIVVMSGEADSNIGLPTARKIAKQLCHLPKTSRALLVLPSDSHQGVSVKSGHGSAGAPDSRYDFALDSQDFPRMIMGLPVFETSVSFNQLDLYGFWRAIVTMNDSLKDGKVQVLGANGLSSIGLGHWADGTAFKPMRVEKPCGDYD